MRKFYKYFLPKEATFEGLTKFQEGKAKLLISNLATTSLLLSKGQTLTTPKQLNFGLLKNQFSTKDTYTIIRNLQDRGLLEVGKSYQQGKASKQYNISPKFDNGFEIQPITDNNVLRILRKFNQQEREAYTPQQRTIIDYASETQSEFTLREGYQVAIDEYISANKSSEKRPHFRQKWVSAICENFANQSITPMISHTNNRLYNNYTSLPRVIKPYISHTSNQPLVELDLKNSQPFFLLCLLKEDSTIDKKELDFYSELVCHGLLYDFMIEKIKPRLSDPKKANLQANGIPLEGKEFRNYFKQEFFKNIFYANRPYTTSPYYQIFREYFKTITLFIFDYKRRTGEHLAISLQKIESDIFVNSVFLQLCQKGITSITRHDSILVEANQERETSDLILSTIDAKYQTKAPIDKSIL